MKKLLVLILTLTLILGSSMGALAKGKPAETGKSNGNGKGKGKNAVITENIETTATGETNVEAVTVTNRAKNKSEEKALREQIRIKRLNTLKKALKNNGVSTEDIEELIEKYQPVRGRFKVKGQHPVFDVPPVIKEGRTLIPVRAIMNGLGAEVSWDGEAQKVTVTRDGKIIEIFLGSQEVLVNGEPVVIDVPAGMIANRVFVPIRFISETLGDKVVYDSETGDVTVGDDTEEEVIEEGTENEDVNTENGEITGEDTVDEADTEENSVDDTTNDETIDENTDNETTNA
jgi:hypothetical protein